MKYYIEVITFQDLENEDHKAYAALVFEEYEKVIEYLKQWDYGDTTYLDYYKERDLRNVLLKTDPYVLVGDVKTGFVTLLKEIAYQDLRLMDQEKEQNDDTQ